MTENVYEKYNGWTAIDWTWMNVHSDMSLDTEEIINTFAIKHPRRIKFKNILEDVE